MWFCHFSRIWFSNDCKSVVEPEQEPLLQRWAVVWPLITSKPSVNPASLARRSAFWSDLTSAIVLGAKFRFSAASNLWASVLSGSPAMTISCPGRRAKSRPRRKKVKAEGWAFTVPEKVRTRSCALFSHFGSPVSLERERRLRRETELPEGIAPSWSSFGRTGSSLFSIEVEKKPPFSSSQPLLAFVRVLIQTKT